MIIGDERVMVDGENNEGRTGVVGDDHKGFCKDPPKMDFDSTMDQPPSP